MGHKHQTTDATRIKRLVDGGVSMEQLAKEFGVTKAVVNKWVKTDVAPYWTRLACEALERRSGKYVKILFVTTVPKENYQACEAVIKAMDGKIDLVRAV